MRELLDIGLTRRKRIDLVRQTEAAECGLASLAMVANAHGFVVDLNAMRRRFSPSLRGASLRTLIDMADRIGFAARALKLPMEGIAGLHMPAVLHWDMNHYVVLERVRGARALIHDPAKGSRWIQLGELSRHFTGVALELRPGDDFEPVKARETLKLRQLWRRMTGLKRSLLQVLVLSLVMQSFVLAAPYYMQVAIDSALPALDRNLLAVLALGFALFTLVSAVASLLRSYVLLSAGASLSFGVSGNMARRLFRLPVSWFAKRHVGDVLSRFRSIAPIQQALTQGSVAAVLDGLLAVLILCIMLIFSGALTLIAVAAAAAYALTRWISFAYERRGQEEVIVAGASEQTFLMENVRGMVTLRLFNRESSRHAQWQSRLAVTTNATVALARIGIWQQTAEALVFGLENILVVWISVAKVMDGGFSVGMVFAYLAYKTEFLKRSGSLVDQAIAFRMLGLHLERLSDIALTDEDASFGQKTAENRTLRGAIELRNVRYRYSPSDPLVLKGIDLQVDPGDHLAITGLSGGGKSTLVRILLGLIEPSEGLLLVDGEPLSAFGYRNYREQVGAVLQEDSLFAGNLADNIALFDDAPDQARIVEAAEAAAIHEDICRMPMRYETLVGDMGSSLSGGQKQRVLLARALYKRPRMLVLDEGTSHLDPECERKVNDSISRLGITRVIIAHRRETIEAADRVVRLEDGLLVAA